MRHTKWFLSVMGIAVLCLFGCGKAQPPEPAAEGRSNAAVDTSALKTAFQGAAVSLMGTVQETIVDINETNYPDAYNRLVMVSKVPSLSSAQKKAVEEVMAKLQSLGAGKTE